ncbi:MAG: hypothetical protein HY902_14955 [Deltaproteobacteria bacterium]|nr:hypothetical protein [Deltaproteobacteria bacterium]
MGPETTEPADGADLDADYASPEVADVDATLPYDAGLAPRDGMESLIPGCAPNVQCHPAAPQCCGDAPLLQYGNYVGKLVSGAAAQVVVAKDRKSMILTTSISGSTYVFTYSIAPVSIGYRKP